MAGMMSTAGKCRRLHELLERLSVIRYPVNTGRPLPDNGVYFFYERGEIQAHGREQRIVNVGTHTGDGNLAQRISSHYIPDSEIDHLTPDKKAPKDRSIFRKHIGRAILEKEDNPYLKTWEIDFTERENREKLSHLRDMRLEMRIEKECNRILESAFSFKVVIVKSKEERMGLRKRLVGTLSGCAFCRASDGWLGRHSPVDKIRRGKLWNVHHLGSDGLTDTDMESMSYHVEDARDWLESGKPAVSGESG